MKKIIYAGAYDSSNYDEAKSRYDKALVIENGDYKVITE